MVFGTRHNPKSKSDNLIIGCNDGTYLHQVDQTKYLGFCLESTLTFRPRFDNVLHKLSLEPVFYFDLEAVLHLMYERNSLHNAYYHF